MCWELGRNQGVGVEKRIGFCERLLPCIDIQWWVGPMERACHKKRRKITTLFFGRTHNGMVLGLGRNQGVGVEKRIGFCERLLPCIDIQWWVGPMERACHKKRRKITTLFFGRTHNGMVLGWSHGHQLQGRNNPGNNGPIGGVLS
ncbi:hypothetical protein Glove_391g12 [Diversispora epigaea]|uniref:Uncharacterized protein n=1 Tax=Diversispora epigaea TaxID=1348612 RepID=A0A397H6H3_9GLOM|nr:hypothetical protein Glove_391g12 [Diversispora epigaea]